MPNVDVNEKEAQPTTNNVPTTFVTHIKFHHGKTARTPNTRLQPCCVPPPGTCAVASWNFSPQKNAPQK